MAFIDIKERLNEYQVQIRIFQLLLIAVVLYYNILARRNYLLERREYTYSQNAFAHSPFADTESFCDLSSLNWRKYTFFLLRQ